MKYSFNCLTSFVQSLHLIPLKMDTGTVEECFSFTDADKQEKVFSLLAKAVLVVKNGRIDVFRATKD